MERIDATRSSGPVRTLGLETETEAAILKPLKRRLRRGNRSVTELFVGALSLKEEGRKRDVAEAEAAAMAIHLAERHSDGKNVEASMGASHVPRVMKIYVGPTGRWLLGFVMPRKQFLFPALSCGFDMNRILMNKISLVFCMGCVFFQ